ncbi:hypothetical protein D3C80_2140730 [compost metagenome]
MGIHGRSAFSLTRGVLLECHFQLVGNANVVHHQAALLVFEHTVDAGNGLHQIVSLHGLIDVQRMHAGSVKAGQPHVANDH